MTVSDTDTPARATRKPRGYPTSVYLTFEEIRALDKIAAQARELDPHHPNRARMTLVARSVRRFLDDPKAIDDAINETTDGD